MSPPPNLLAQRYRFSKAIRRTAKSAAWLAVDQVTRQTVVVQVASSRKVEPFAALIPVRHPHLAAVLEVLPTIDPASIPVGEPIAEPGAVIAEYVPGTTMRELLRAARMRPLDAAVSFARVASALDAIHRAGCVHGAVSCESVVTAPGSGAPGPVLTQLVTVPSAVYCSPERGAGHRLGPADDVWALHAALFISLTRTAPFPGSTFDEIRAALADGKLRSMEELGVRDPTLQGILDRGLLIDPDLRRCQAREVERTLTLWAQQIGSVPDGGESIESGSRDSTLPDPAELQESGAAERAPPSVPSDSRPAASAPDYDAVRERVSTQDDIDTRVMTAEELQRQLQPGKQPPPERKRPRRDPQPRLPSPQKKALAHPRAAVPRVGSLPHAPSVPAPEPRQVVASAIVVPSPLAAPHGEPELPREVIDSSELEVIEDEASPPVSSPSPERLSPSGAIGISEAESVAAEQAEAAQTRLNSPLPSVLSEPPSRARVPRKRTRRRGTWPLGLLLAGVLAACAIVAAVALAPDRVVSLVSAVPWLKRAIARGAALRGSSSHSREDYSGPPPIGPAAPTATQAPAAAVASSAPVFPATSAPVLPTASAPESPPNLAAAAPVASSVPQPAQPAEAPAGLPVTKQLNACVTTFFEEGTFIPWFEHDFRFLCADLDIREVNAGVLRALVSHGAGKITPGMRIWSTLGWYELTATALMRGSCCPPGTPPLQVPPAGVPCDTLRDVLQEMTQVEPGADRARQLTDGFAQGVYCFFSRGVPRPYYYRKPPSGYAHDQFVLFMDMAAKRRAENSGDGLARSQP